jgi:exonuclease VII large subunit
MATSKIKGLDEQQLEGGGGGAGGFRSARGANEKRLEQRINEMSPKERASLEDVGKQFEKQSPTAEKAQAKTDKVNSERKAPKEVTNYFEMTDAQRANLTPAQLRRLGADATYAKGGAVTASRRADGIAQRGKTKGRMC